MTLPLLASCMHNTRGTLEKEYYNCKWYFDESKVSYVVTTEDLSVYSVDVDNAYLIKREGIDSLNKLCVYAHETLFYIYVRANIFTY